MRKLPVSGNPRLVHLHSRPMPDAGPPKTGSREDAGKAGDQDEPLTRKSLEWNTGWGWGGGGMEGSLAGRGEEMKGFVAMDGLISHPN